MLWAAGIGREAYDPETISMLTTVIGASRSRTSTPGPHRREKGAAGVKHPIGGRRGERDPLLLYATALGGGPWEPAIGEGPASQPIRSNFGRTSRIT